MTAKRVLGLLVVLTGLCVGKILIDHSQVVYDYLVCSQDEAYADMACFWGSEVLGRYFFTSSARSYRGGRENLHSTISGISA